jgi:hypothetical protein
MTRPPQCHNLGFNPYDWGAREAVAFRLSLADRPGIVHQLLQLFSEESQNILMMETVALELRLQHLAELIAEDSSNLRGYSSLLRLCRALQAIDECNHLLAEFVQILVPKKSEGPSFQARPPVLRSGVAPFESLFSGQLITVREPIHPDNVSVSDMRPALSELDRAAAKFIKDPDRLFAVKPSELEAIVAGIYKAHGFDVRITGGPRDHGIDVSAEAFIPVSLPRKFSQHIRIGIQVKRYRRDHKVTESEVRDLYGSVVGENLDRGIIFTTSSLTAAAQEYIAARRAVQDRLTIVAGDDILEVIISYCKQRWIPFWK